jgi:hypothetical protein
MQSQRAGVSLRRNNGLPIRRETDMSETNLRGAERHRCWLKALFVFNDGRCSLDALVRNISDDGALLECEDMRLLPPEFDLVITLANGDLSRHHAKHVWKHDGAVGVKFLEGRIDTRRHAPTIQMN